MSDNSSFVKFLQGQTQLDITHEGKIYTVSYVRGRKDTVLIRMYEQALITMQEFQQAVYDGISISLHSKAIDIKAPHFVFWIKDTIENTKEFQDLGIDKETLMK